MHTGRDSAYRTPSVLISAVSVQRASPKAQMPWCFAASALNHCGVTDVSVTSSALKGVLPLNRKLEEFEESTLLTKTEPVE